MNGKGTSGIFILMLMASLPGLLLSWNLTRIVIDQVIAPRAVLEQKGWWTRFSSPSRPLPVDDYEVFLPAGKTIALNPDFKHVTAWIIWFVPADGLYKIQFAAEAVSRVNIDGQTLLKAFPRSTSKRVEGCWRKLTAGPHLIRLDLNNNIGGGWFSIGVLTPPLMRMKALQGDMVAMPRLGNLETWWWVMRLSRPVSFFFASIVCLSLLALLLPVAICNRKQSTIITLVLALIPAMLIPDMARREPYIGPMVHRALQKKKPQFVFIGNSMLWSRIDDELLEHLLGGTPVFSIVNFGGLAGIHYLALKYLLIPAKIQPKRVFIFFRGTTLVEPGSRTTGRYFETLIERISPAPDPEFERLAHGRVSSTTSRLQNELKRIFPVQGNNQILRDAVSRFSLWLSIPGWKEDREKKRDELRMLVNKRFALKNISAGISRESLRQNQSKEHPDFTTTVNDSFLPAIIGLARQHNLPLAFIRVQERPLEGGAMQDDPEMQKFMADLQRYLSGKGVALYDFTGDRDLPLSMYGLGDHIEDPKEYTPIFFNRLHALLQ